MTSLSYDLHGEFSNGEKNGLVTKYPHDDTGEIENLIYLNGGIIQR